MSKTIKITEDKFKRVLREVFKEEVYQSNQEPFAGQAEEKKLEMGVGNDGTLEHNVGTEFGNETRDANFYPGLNDKPI